MKVLIVGAGAVGQAYGYHLQRGGAEVAFFVRERYRAALAEGVIVYPLNRKEPWAPVGFADFGLHTTWETVGVETWDQVWLAVPSTAIRTGWLPEMIAAVGDATVVALQPGLEDRDVLLAHIPEAQLVAGVITLQSFHAPLPGGKTVEPGMAWWFPPFSPIPLGGEATVVRKTAAILKKGGCPAAAKPNQEVTAVGASSVMMPIIAALESADWSFAKLRSTSALALGCDAARQCAAVVAQARGRSAPLFVALVRPWLLGLVLRAAPLVMPFNLERFFEYHFTKVGAQTRLMLATYVRRGGEMKLPTERVEELRGLLR